MKKIVSLAISLALLLLIYLHIDFGRVAAALAGSSPGMLAAALFMFIPLIGFTGMRLSLMVPGRAIGAGESIRLNLAAGTLNMVLPSKMGDVVKAYFIRRRGLMTGSASLTLVIFEKSCDVLALLLWCLFGLLTVRPLGGAAGLLLAAAVGAGFAFVLLMLGSLRFANLFFGLLLRLPWALVARKAAELQGAWSEMHAHFWTSPGLALRVILFSVFIWFLHLLQIWFFMLSLGPDVSLATNLALTPIAVFIGLLPFTFAGVGTRDAALILLYSPYFDAAAAAALGLYCTSRYVVPALCGLPFFHRYMSYGGEISEQKPGGRE